MQTVTHRNSGRLPGAHLLPYVHTSILLLGLCAAAPAAGLPLRDWAGNAEVVFALDFEGDAYAWKAAGSAFPVGTEFELAPGGHTGSAWRNTSKLGYLAFDGRGNVPPAAGTVSLQVKGALFADGKRRCLAALPRTTEGMASKKEDWTRRGLALSLRKTEANTLDLVVHVGGDAWMRSSKPVAAISVDAKALSPTDWHHVAFSWDFTTRTLWLAVDGQVQQAPIPEEVREPHAYLALVLGNTEDYLASNQEPIDGLMDDVAVLKVAYPAALRVMASRRPYNAPRPQPPVQRAKATLFREDPALARCEEVARAHLNLLVQTQRHGGWCLAVKWPSLLQYTAKFRLPEPANLVWLSKDSHTAFGAAQLLWAYQALGDESYLKAACNTAEMYLKTQDPKHGCWIHGYSYEEGRYVPAAQTALIQDHCQTGPIVLLAYAHRVTGDARYLDAAKRGADFLMRAQNPNGSWSHHYDPAKGRAATQLDDAAGGEVNDYGTSAPVATLLRMHRLTGEAKYREAALKGADWLVAAFIRNERVCGWAGQYDDQNRPVAARHFEPVAVTHYAPRWAAMGLIAAYRETRDEKYLAPLRQVVAWFDANKGEGGWWWDYDIETGRPIAMWQRKTYFLDDPAQMQAYVEATGRPAPGRGDWVNLESLRREVQQAAERPEGTLLSQPGREELRKYVQATAPLYVKEYIDGGKPPLNREVGLYTWETESGLSTNLVRHQVVRFCDLLMRARAARGDIPADDPVFRHIEAFVGWHQVMPGR